MTCAQNLNLKAEHVKQTWAKRCNKLLFISDKNNDSFPAIGVNTTLGRRHLTAKTMNAFDYIYQNHLDDADWFLKADDDTYVIVENLRHMLSAHAPSKPIYFGHTFDVIVEQGFPSGGGGYVLSKGAMHRFHHRNVGLCASDGGLEDVEIGKCMAKLHVTLGNSTDEHGRSRFHCLNLYAHMHHKFPKWYYKHVKHDPQKVCR
jgi:glycoprotein-N-acetylgalactosamine 3-beta-galactosyltransferase